METLKFSESNKLKTPQPTQADEALKEAKQLTRAIQTKTLMPLFDACHHALEQLAAVFDNSSQV